MDTIFWAYWFDCKYITWLNQKNSNITLNIWRATFTASLVCQVVLSSQESKVSILNIVFLAAVQRETVQSFEGKNKRDLATAEEWKAGQEGNNSIDPRSTWLHWGRGHGHNYWTGHHCSEGGTSTFRRYAVREGFYSITKETNTMHVSDGSAQMYRHSLDSHILLRQKLKCACYFFYIRDCFYQVTSTKKRNGN